MESPPCAISVVICTYNRARGLAKALGALLAQTGGVEYEVIVVDNNSTDETKDVIASQLGRSGRLKYRFEGRQGLPYARNTGVIAAAAPIIAFTDDDVRVGPDWVETIKRTFDAHPGVDMIGGRVRPVWPSAVPSWITRRQLGPFALGERGDAPVRVSAANAAPCLVGANFAFRRAVFERVGLFDPAFIKSQDREIQLRLWRTGGVGLYVPDLAIAVDIPEQRLTKRYFRDWYTTYGVYHSRMRLLDIINRDGRLDEPRGRRVLGAPAFLYRELLQSAGRWLASAVRLDGASAFYWENRCRYLFSYLRERRRARSRPAAAADAAERIPVLPPGREPSAA
jgi:glycosyltransferase involved in cell wall biosynthesis